MPPALSLSALPLSDMLALDPQAIAIALLASLSSALLLGICWSRRASWMKLLTKRGEASLVELHASSSSAL